MKPAAHYRISSAPHLKHSDAAFKIAWTQAAALLPALIVSIILFPLKTLISLAVVSAAVVLSGFICAKIFKRNFELLDLRAIITAVLFLLLLPVSYPLPYMILGISIAVLGREIFGGKGTCFINTALLGNVFLQLNFPSFFHRGSGILFIDSGGIGAWLVLIALLTGGAILVSRKTLEWDLPLIYTMTVLILEKLSPEAIALSIRHVLFAAFFLMLEPGTMPLTRNGRRLIAFSAAVTGWLLDSATRSGYVPAPEVFAFLLMNLVTVWLDQWLVPAGAAQTREMAKA